MEPMETVVSVHCRNASEIKVESYPYKEFPGDWLTIKTDAGRVTFHSIDFVTFKNEVLWAFQGWERKHERTNRINAKG